MKVFLALLLLYMDAYCQQDINNTKLAINTSETENMVKTFRGKSSAGELLPSHVINDMTEVTTNNVQKCSSERSNTLKVNNSTVAYLRSSFSTKLIPAIYIAVVLIGVPSNAIILWMLFCSARSVCTATFYTSLAVSDLLFCIMLPFKIAYHLNGNHWVFGEAMCRVMTIFFYGNMYCSILLLMCISITRYIAIVHPFLYRSLPQQFYANLLCALVWAIVLVYMIPLFTTTQTHYLEELDIVSCHDVHDATGDAFQFYYFISLAVFGFLFPFSTVVFCYFSIFRVLGTHDQKRFQYVKITTLLLVIFAICFTPSNTILIIHQVGYHSNNTDSMYSFYLMALCLSSLNSCLDPFVYFLMSKILNPSNNYNTIIRFSNKTHMKYLSA
ncbi:hypothetical protein FKM82_000336 [Ascaphus truei]